MDRHQKALGNIVSADGQGKGANIKSCFTRRSLQVKHKLPFGRRGGLWKEIEEGTENNQVLDDVLPDDGQRDRDHIKGNIWQKYERSKGEQDMQHAQVYDKLLPEVKDEEDADRHFP